MLILGKTKKKRSQVSEFCFGCNGNRANYVDQLVVDFVWIFG